jgi:6-phosphogluconolactonase
MHHELETLPDPDPDPDAVARGRRGVRGPARPRCGCGQRQLPLRGQRGHTPWAMFAELASETVPWEAVVIYQVDERVAPPDDPDRNLTHLNRALGSAPW